MDWKYVLSQPMETYDDEQLEDIFNELILMDTTTKFDTKLTKKFFKLSLYIFRFKERQIKGLQSEIRELSNQQVVLQSGNDSEQVSRLKSVIDSLEIDKANYKSKCREHTQEIALLLKRLQENPEEDSGDAFSDLDRQQELMKNISTKNKHIKRLLRDIEDLETDNLRQAHQITELQTSQTDTNLSLATLTQQFHESQVIIHQYNESARKQAVELTKLQENLHGTLKEKSQLSTEVETFARQLEERALVWKEILDSKENELKALQKKYKDILAKNPGYDIDIERGEIERLTQTLQERHKHVTTLELTLQALTSEIEALKQENQSLFEDKLTMELDNGQKEGRCCAETKSLLQKSNDRCQELHEIITNIEEDNTTKARQAFEAIEKLKSYEKGQYGLSDALKEIGKLEDRIIKKDSKIKALVADLNAANQLAIENCVLRKKLGIPVDTDIKINSFIAKQHRFEKLNERLMLKLKGYEEMILQLKIERNELRRKNDKTMRTSDPLNSNDSGMKFCLECSIQFASWPGCTDCVNKQKCKYCLACQEKLGVQFTDETMENDKFKQNYETVVEENENLRIGMHEILQQLRESSANSSTINIESSTLEQLLLALDQRSVSGWYHPAMRLQNELQLSKEREIALIEKLRASKDLTKVSKEHSLTKSVDTSGALDEKQRLVDLEKELQCKTIELEKVRKMIEFDDESQIQILKENDRLKNIERLYNQLVSTLEKSDSEKDHLLHKTLKDVQEIESRLSTMNRKLNFFTEENTKLCLQLKEFQMDYLTKIRYMKSDIISNNTSTTNQSKEEECCKLQKENFQLKLQISSSIASIAKHILSSDDLNQFDTNKLENVAVIKENLAVEYLTIEELNELKRQASDHTTLIDNWKKKVEHLELLLNVVNEQLIEQQKMITQQSDEEINLRHLVSDLQSLSHDHYILRKTSFELDEVRKSEKKLRDKVLNLEKKIFESEKSTQCYKDEASKKESINQHEKRTDLLKIMFLKKSLLNLRDSYQLYTPLFAVTDYLQLYKDVKDQRTLKSLSPNLPDLSYIEQKFKDMSNENDVKLRIKILELEAQNLFLNRELAIAKESNEDLVNSNEQLKIKALEEGQHWKTIAMLFDPLKSMVSHGSQTHIVSFTSIATNTYEEKLDGPERPPSVKEWPCKIVPNNGASHKSLEIQLRQALGLASTRSALLVDAEARLAETKSRLVTLERTLDDKDVQLRATKVPHKLPDERNQDTIASLQNLLLEKDTTLSRYQELLRADREGFEKTCEDHFFNMKKLQNHISSLENQVRIKDEQIAAFHDQQKKETQILSDVVCHNKESWKIKDLEQDIQRIHETAQQKESLLSEQILERDAEILKLKQTTVHPSNAIEDLSKLREIEQLRELIEEKDRHIQDLIDTISNFHDDQDRFINDSDVQSTEQVTQLSVDLNRCESTKKILKTQLDAVKRQLTNVSTRESQARELIKNLKGQLIKRPVISIKSDCGTGREEQLRKRNIQLQSELENVRDELRRQQMLNENRRARNASDLGLWEKQKRWQRTAERLKVQLKERDLDIARLHSTLQIAKKSVMRLEKEKHVLEQRRLICSSASCPNLLKYTQAESPESYITMSPDINIINESNSDLVDALKTRVEAQQRRISALELESRGESAFLKELDALNDTCSELRAENVKLEAKLLQAKLEVDKFQNGAADTGAIQSENKYLEEYVSHAKNEISKIKSALRNAATQLVEEKRRNEQLEKTVITKTIHPDNRVSRDLYENLKEQFNRMQKMYTEVTEKLTSLQIELKSCSQCKENLDISSGSDEGSNEDLERQLIEKTKLLDRAKILLTRAAAREKNLKEQIAYLRRKCSELQNVPVIEEASE